MALLAPVPNTVKYFGHWKTRGGRRSRTRQSLDESQENQSLATSATNKGDVGQPLARLRKLHATADALGGRLIKDLASDRRVLYADANAVVQRDLLRVGSARGRPINDLSE